MLKSSAEACWVKNISSIDIRVEDLNLVLKAGSVKNLLDARHFHLTREQVSASLISGSLFRKSHAIRLTHEPVKRKEKEIEMCEFPIILRKRTGVEMEQRVFESEKEFENDSDEKWAQDFAEGDSKPVTIKKA